MDLDILCDILKPYYSNSVSPATFQPEIFRSFALMLFQKGISITKLVNNLKYNNLYLVAIGWASNKTPSLGANYDFISRLWLYDIKTYRKNLKKLRLYKKKPSKTKSPGKNNKLPGKNNKLPNKIIGVVGRIVDYF